MPWCPKCGIEYRPGFETCAECGEALVAGDPRPAHLREVAESGALASSLSGVGAGCLGGLIGWIGWFLLPAFSVTSVHRGLFLSLLPIACSFAAFVVGVLLNSRFMSSLIGWLLISTPFLVLIGGLGYAHMHLPTATATLVLCSLFSPIIVGPLATVAGTRFARAPRLANLALWLIPTGTIAMALLVAGHLITEGK